MNVPLISFFEKLIFWSCAIAAVGILFRIQNWPGYENMLYTGGLIMITDEFSICSEGQEAFPDNYDAFIQRLKAILGKEIH